jgi:hypothetical protein
MEISGIIFIEKGNIDCIHLYKEGSFWKAYEQSAYLFVEYIKPYRTKLRYYKNINMNVISIGFPDVALANLIDKRKINFQSAMNISIDMEKKLEEEAFNEWKSKAILLNSLVEKEMQSKERKQEKNATGNEDGYLRMAIRSFPTADRTPMECMQFLVEIQKLI